MNIGILSYGMVSPGGIGPESLEKEWPCTKIRNALGTRSHDVALVDRTLPELARWDREPRLRRASPVTTFIVESANQALEAAPEIDLSRTGVVVSYFLGCLIYSIRFYREMIKDGRRFASPILFPETVFNSPVSHLVTTLGLGGPVYSQVGDKSCWANALRTAKCWLLNGSADHVIVIGAEEFDPHELDAFHAAAWLRGGNLIPSEGAGALLLTACAGNRMLTLSEVEDGYCFFNKQEAMEAARSCLQEFPEKSPILPSATSWAKKIEPKVLGKRALSCDNRQSSLPFEASTASAAWDTIRACRYLERKREGDLIIPYWGLSHQFAAARISSPPLIPKVSKSQSSLG